MNPSQLNLAASETSFEREVAARFGLLPNFFRTAEAAPGLMQELWSFVKSAYLDNPLPSAFKERLIVHLSRFCEVRYCVIRHVGFLTGYGNTAGDASVPPHSIGQAMALLRHPIPNASELEAAITRLERHAEASGVPGQETQLEADLLDALAVVFLQPVDSDRARLAVRRYLGDTAFELAIALLAFVRVVHYWTETHPEMAFDEDMVLLMKEHPDLASLLMNDAAAEATNQKNQIRRALVENQKRAAELAAIVESSDDAIISKNLDGVITSWNAAASRLLGYSAEEIIGQSILTLIPEDLKADEVKIIESVRAGRRLEHLETVRLTKDGRLIEVSLTVSPVKDELGRVIGASKILRDISERKRIEKSLLQAEKIAATGRMAATIAHEINNPLEAITNLLYLLRSKITDEEGQNHLATAEEELGRVSHIARQTLGYYREHAAASTATLSAIVRHAVTIYQPRCSAAGIDIRTSFQSSREAVLRRGEIMQVISNLIANSIYAMPAGGLLSIAVDDVDEPAGGTQLTISDNGVGIAPHDLPNVFQAFFTTRATVGTGIGLFVAKQFAEGHGGQISITSQNDAENHGTTVRIFLPLHTAYENSPHA
ncbi:MAG TPA: PAS domain S-box protein [Terracidiphilus sp.]|jgi:PAS domain S-box-containing protein|nr:PAS domain S-box protein [Terracidiphilus sp.]